MLQKEHQLHILSEPVAYVSHRLNKGMARVLDLAPESPYVDVYGSITTIIIIAPHLIEQSFPSKDPTTITCQKLEQLILSKGQHYQLPF